MNYRTFGKIGARVSALGFGAMNLPGVPFEQAKAALHHALDQGITYIDTAAAYRNSEEIIGDSISHRRSEFFLATKTNKRDYESAKEDIERSLNRLKTDSIDLLQIHYVNFVKDYEQIMGPDGAYRAALEAKSAGKVRHIGITGHRPELLARWVRSGHFDQVLFHLNLAQPFAAQELIPTLAELDLARVVMKPLSGGFIQPVRQALRYPLSQNIHVVISGMVSREEVDENVAAFADEVGDDERTELQELAAVLGTHDCRRCNYCSCPIGIPVPDTMISSRVRETIGLLPKGMDFYSKHKEKIMSCADYEPCKTQPECEAKCPYQLPIRTTIKHAAAYYEA